MYDVDLSRLKEHKHGTYDIPIISYAKIGNHKIKTSCFNIITCTILVYYKLSENRACAETNIK